MSIIAIGDQRPEVYSEKDIYDPDVHGTDTSILGGLGGPYVPKVDSLVVDINSRVKRVAAVNPVTYKVTYSRIHVDPDGMEDTLINYGNEIYCIYYDNSTTPNKLIIDAKVVIFGTNAFEYRLMKTVNDEPTSIGMYINIHGEYLGDRIPMIESGVTGIKTCSNAYTNIPLNPNEIINLEIYDADGELISEIKLVSTKANALSLLPTITNPIVDFIIHSSQERGDEIVCFSNQDPYEIGIYPTVVYSDGSTEHIAIDGQDCIMYGLAEIVPPHVGTRFKIICKYWPSLTANITEGLIDPGMNHIVSEKFVVIDDFEEHPVAKVSLLPTWDAVINRWDLRARSYKYDKWQPEDVTTQLNWVNTIDLALHNLEQSYELEITVGEMVIFTQTGTITLKHFSQLEPWVIDTYGADSPTVPRPEIQCTSNEYSLNLTKFPDTSIFLQAFYLNADPPWDIPGGETTVVTPTHFIIRDIALGKMLVPSPISVDDYGLQFDIIETVPSEYKSKTVLVEFLLAVGTTYTTIYGVPVEIK